MVLPGPGNLSVESVEQFYADYLEDPARVPADWREYFRGSGDVKYHLGYRNRYFTAAGPVLELTLCFNASHLEFDNPVAMGLTRARQDRGAVVAREQAVLVLIHGDAAFAGEGVVQETLNMSQLPGYGVGGTLHVIVNNQIGFTTATTRRACSPSAPAAVRRPWGTSKGA
jgi:2-oxoglutarate dehydrogenase complex dehydrogenase (E1) component-like enzyme